MEKKFEIFIEDVGDRSVGLQSEITLRAELSESIIEHLNENKILKKFEKKLKELVNEFFEPETHYTVYDTFDLEYEKLNGEEL